MFNIKRNVIISAICLSLVMLTGCGDKEKKQPLSIVTDTSSSQSTQSSKPVSSVTESSDGVSSVSSVQSVSSVSSVSSAPEQSSEQPPEQSVVSTTSSPGQIVPPEVEPVTVVYNNDPLNKCTITFDGEGITVRGVKGKLIANGGGAEPEMAGDSRMDGDELVCTFTPYSYGGGWRYGYFVIYDENWYGNAINIVNVNGAPMFPDVSAVLGVNRAVLDSVTTLSAGQTAQYITIDGTTENAASIWSDIEKISNEICKGIDSDYDKLRAISRWVSDNIYYDNPIMSAGAPKYCLSLEYMLNNKSSICGGYSNMTSALCAVQGIRCYNISGTAVLGRQCFQQGSPGQFHEWNVAEVDGRYIIIDSGWNSNNYFNADGTYSTGTPRYRYFDIGEEVFALNHKAQKAEYRNYLAVLNR